MNIYDLGYIYFSIGKENEHFMNRDIDNKFAGSYIGGVLDFFLRFFYYLLKSPLRFDQSLKKNGAVMIYGESVNNRNTLLPILEEMANASVIDLHSHTQYPKWRLYWYAMPHLGEFVKELKNNPQEKRDTIKNFFAKFWMMYGCERTAKELLDFYQPKMVVMANDHLPFHRSLMHEANKKGIPTMYVQHAAVTEKFPPLNFTYSLLDGEDSYKKYRLKEETTGNIYLCGGIRFDAVKASEKKESEKKVVGVAINLVDDEKIVKDVCIIIKEGQANDTIQQVILRPHPQMQLDMWKEWCVDNGIGFSLAKEETSFEFLSRISVLVSNQSSIHLDAAMCHTPSCVYKLSTAKLNDSYSFVKNKLTHSVDNMDDLLHFISTCDSYEPNPEAVKFYNCSYGASYEGHVAKMMASLIEQILKGDEESFRVKYGFVLKEQTENRVVYQV